MFKYTGQIILLLIIIIIIIIIIITTIMNEVWHTRAKGIPIVIGALGALRTAI